MQDNTGYQKTTRTDKQPKKHGQTDQKRDKAKPWTRTDKRASY